MLSIIDSHVHFWDPAHLRYDWLAGSAILNQVYRPERLPAQGDGWRLEKLVFVQADCAADQGHAEVEWVAALAAQHPVVSGIVAFAPLEHGERARPQLDWLVQQPLVKGVRRLIQAEGPGFAVQPDFVRGVALLAEYGLSFDLCLRNDQLREAIDLARQCPAVAFVLDHIGNPDIQAGRRDPWREDVAGLAALPNMKCKVSGVVTRADHEHWKPADLRPYIEYVLDVFGPERVMFGSDWPVMTLAARYQQWVDALQATTAALPEASRRKLFSENARAFYRLPALPTEITA
jgi:L-fuconolactonase